jgi:hypothetical protein
MDLIPIHHHNQKQGKTQEQRYRVSLNSRSMKYNTWLGEQNEHVTHEEPPKHQFLTCHLIKHTWAMSILAWYTSYLETKTKFQHHDQGYKCMVIEYNAQPNESCKWLPFNILHVICYFNARLLTTFYVIP